jgi:ABC transport system ATP-binding/permease protein
MAPGCEYLVSVDAGTLGHHARTGTLGALVVVLVDLRQVTVRRADRVLFEGLSFTISDGDRVGVVGVNGTGKSTLLRILAGVDAPEEGQVRRGRGSRVGFLEQVPELPLGTVRAAVGQGWEAEATLDRLGMGNAVDDQVALLSGGRAKRVALARVLTHPADLLVLDEPTNHLDLGAVAWLENRLRSFGGGLVLVTHDRHLLDRVTTRILELDRGTAYVHEGGYVSYLAAKSEREERSAAAESTRRNLARRELAWLRRGAQARSRKPQARVDSAIRLIEDRPSTDVRSVAIETGTKTPRLGDKVIECTGVGFRYDDGPVVLSGVDLMLGRRERLGIVGANGTGKSTLLDLLAGRIQPTTGTIGVGPTVVVGYYDQQGSTLDLHARVQDLVAGPHRSAPAVADVEMMKRFLFSGELPFARVGTLSGGERRRLQLLLVLVRRPNVLLLDEPTNDLDLDTLRILEDWLEEWPGALVVVSHDRTLLDRTTERLVALGVGGAVSAVPGGVTGWVARLEYGDLRRAGLLPSPVPAPRRPRATGAGSPRPGGDPVPIGRLLRAAEKNWVRLVGERDRILQSLTEAVDHMEMTRLGGVLAETQAELERAEELWLALAEETETQG